MERIQTTTGIVCVKSEIEEAFSFFFCNHFQQRCHLDVCLCGKADAYLGSQGQKEMDCSVAGSLWGVQF